MRARSAGVTLLVLIAVGAAIALARHPNRAAGARCGAGSTFYVDAVHGNDHRCGRSPALAWRTIARVNRAHLRAGDQVLFRGGETVQYGAAKAGPSFAPVLSLRPRSGVTYASYGSGLARFGPPRARDGSFASSVFLCRAHDVVLRDLRFEGDPGTERAATAIASGERLARCRGSVSITVRRVGIRHFWQGIQAGYADAAWTIEGVRIEHTAANGILFDRRDGDPAQGGRQLSVLGSTILDTGEHPPHDYPVHGIYDNASDSRLIGNTISRFQTDGISVRFHGATVSGNRISDGALGIGVFAFDRASGTTRIVDNAIWRVRDGIFVCGPAESCMESPDRFEISGNRFRDVAGQPMNLQPTQGGYSAQPGQSAMTP